MNRYRFSESECPGDRNARLAGEGWSGRDAKRSPRQATYDAQQDRRLAERYRELVGKPEERKP